MSDDNSIYPRYNRQPWHRRRRSVEGKSWAPPTAQSVERGVWCSRCKVRHPYNGANKLATEYVKEADGWHMLWLCPNYLDVIGELEWRPALEEDPSRSNGNSGRPGPDGGLPEHDTD